METLLAAWTLLVLAANVGAPPAGDRRERAAAPAPLVTTPEVRWSFGPLAFEGAPVVTRSADEERVLVHGRDGTGRRALVVLDGPSGRVLARTLLAAEAPLAIAASGERVAVRTMPDRVDLFRLRAARLLLERSFTPGASISAPRLEGDELLLREGAELACYDLGQRQPRWRARVPGTFLGAPAVRGAHLFAGWQAEDGTAHVAWLERASGALRGDLPLGKPAGGRAPEPDAFEIQAHASVLFAHLASGLPGTSGALYPWARIPFDGAALASARLHAFWAAPQETASGWVGAERARDGSARWILARRDPLQDGEQAIELASSAHHRWLAACTTPPSGAGEVLYLGPAAVDARTLQVLWRRERAPDFAPLAVPGGLLVIEGDRLHRLGGPEPVSDRARTRALEVAAAAEQELAGRLTQLASQALRAGDPELARRLVADAEALGASGRALELVRTESERARAAPAGPRADPRRAALAAEEHAARAAVARALAQAAHLAAEPAEKRALLAELFRRAPESAEGLQELARLLPAGAQVARGAPLDWLALAAAAERHPLAIVTAPQPGTRPTPDEERLAAEQAAWRSDASAYQSERLALVTAGTSPRAVAETLRTGELLCDVLEQSFGGTRPGAERLTLVLYPTREEYLAHSGTDLGGLEGVLGFTAGHFDLAAEVSRLYTPEEAGDDARLLAVAAHELAHHWLAVRSRAGPPRAAPATRGFWVVEGIATWIEELRLDVERATWTTDPLRAPSLDTLANAGTQDLLSWRQLTDLTFEGFCRLETRPTCALHLDWQLGSQHPRSPMQLFYAQAGALAHYLHEAEGGRHRARLREAVEGYYRGTPLDLGDALGLEPEALGARVVAWARAGRGAE